MASSLGEKAVSLLTGAGTSVPTESTPLRIAGRISPDAALAYDFGKTKELEALERRISFQGYCLYAGFVAFVLFIYIIAPLIITVHDGWAFGSAMYYAVQAALGIGFGDLSVYNDAMETLMLFEIVAGSVFVAMVAGIFISNAVSREERPADTKLERARLLTPAGHDAHAVAEALRALGFGLLGLLVVFFIGVLYGLLYEEWDFVSSLLFVVSACQTSGLIEPGITYNASEGWCASPPQASTRLPHYPLHEHAHVHAHVRSLPLFPLWRVHNVWTVQVGRLLHRPPLHRRRADLGLLHGQHRLARRAL